MGSRAARRMSGMAGGIRGPELQSAEMFFFNFFWQLIDGCWQPWNPAVK